MTEIVNDASCNANSTDCTINCDACANVIECPSNEDCESCVINCTGETGCQSAAIYSHSCSNVVINCNDDSENSNGPVRQSTIYAPKNFGNLTLNVIDGDDCFRDTTIHAKYQSGFIKLNCNDAADEDNNDECKQMTINATWASNFDLQCTGKCENTQIYCPNNDYSVAGSSGAPCSMTCQIGEEDDNECKGMTIYAYDGTPNDFVFNCEAEEDDVCENSRVQCGIGFGLTCAFETDDNDNWYCDGDCYYTSAPTLFPPTSVPTATLMPTPFVNDTNINDGGGGGINRNLDKKTGGSTVDAIAYNIIFGLVFLAIFGFLSFKFYKLREAGFFDNKHRLFLIIIGVLLVAAFWEFLVCIILGAGEIYLSSDKVLSGTFLVAVSFPINFYIVLSILITVSFFSNKFEALTKGVDKIGERSRGYGAPIVLLVILGGVFGFWMVFSLILSGSNNGNLVFNSFMISVYAILGMVLVGVIAFLHYRKYGIGELKSKEVILGIALGFCSFLMFLFYFVLALAIATSGADGVRVTLLIFELASLGIAAVMYPNIGSDSEEANQSLARIKSASPHAPAAVAPKGSYSYTSDPNASCFDPANLSKLKKDKIEYVEILSKECASQSDNKWESARILEVRSDSNQVWIEYLPDGKSNATGAPNKTEIINLNDKSDAARFRINLFSHPEPWKLPMNKEFGIPDVLVNLLNLLLKPNMRGDLEMGIFRVSAEQKKLVHFQTAICQYQMETYDYRLPKDFEDDSEKQNAFDVHCLSALIKDWVRKFPETVIKYDEEKDELVANRTDSKNDDLKEHLFQWLAYLTVYVADDAKDNKMTEKSLAIVIAPNLIGEDLNPTEHLRLARDLNERFEAYCISLKNTENPIKPPKE